MKSWLGYGGDYFKQMSGLRLSALEQVLLASLVLLCLISVIDSMTGRDIGNTRQLELARQQAQQELMAIRLNQGN